MLLLLLARYREPIVIKFHLTREIEDLKQLKEVVLGLNAIEQIFKKQWDIGLPGSPNQLIVNKTKLIKLKRNTPMEITIQTDQVWIGYLLFFLLNYKDIKENIKEINKDTRNMGFVIKGISSDMWEKLKIDIKFIGESLISSSDKKNTRLSNYCLRIRSYLLGKNLKPTIITVKRISSSKKTKSL